MYTYKIRKQAMSKDKTVYWAVYRPAGISGWFKKWQPIAHSTAWYEEDVIDTIIKHKEQFKK
jgi:hypothetical protein